MVLTRDNIHNFHSWYKELDSIGGAGLFIKDRGWTSMDLVAKLRRLTKVKKVGHCGTLDPLATGLMLILFGKATKSAQEYTNLPKRYQATIKFGARTATFDSEMPEQDFKSISDLDISKIYEVLKNFTGRIEQKPPIFSAKSFQGKKLYKYIRKKNSVDIEILENIREMKKREIEILDISLLSYSNGIGVLDIHCSSGTYIRSLADDIGQKLLTGAYLQSLVRTGIGDYKIEQGFTLNHFIELLQQENFYN